MATQTLLGTSSVACSQLVIRVHRWRVIDCKNNNFKVYIVYIKKIMKVTPKFCEFSVVELLFQKRNTVMKG